jgi:hypothetical protein
LSPEPNAAMSFAFPIPKLTSLLNNNGKPTRLQLLEIQRQLNHNAMSIPSTLSAQFGLLALTTAPAEYQVLNGGVAFVQPVAPPPSAIIPPGTDPEERSELRAQHAVQTKAYDDLKKADRALLRMLRDVVPAIYLEDLNDDTYEFCNITTRVALDHLHGQFSRITSEDMDQNKTRMEAEWSPPTPFQALITQLNVGQKFATVNDEEIADKTLARMGYNNVLRSGAFPEGCREWRKLLEADQTYENFCALFASEERERDARIMSETAGYQGAANSATAPQLSDFAQLMLMMQERDAAQNTRMEQFMAAMVAAKPAPAPAAPKKERGYCWTHGITASTNHTSATCNNPADGHKQEATHQNKMGGSTEQFRPRQRDNRNNNRNRAQPAPEA